MYKAHIIAGLLLLALPLAQTARLATATFRLGRRALPAIETIFEDVIHQFKNKRRKRSPGSLLDSASASLATLSPPAPASPRSEPFFCVQLFRQQIFLLCPSSFVMEHK